MEDQVNNDLSPTKLEMAFRNAIVAGHETARIHHTEDILDNLSSAMKDHVILLQKEKELPGCAYDLLVNHLEMWRDMPRIPDHVLEAAKTKALGTFQRFYFGGVEPEPQS